MPKLKLPLLVADWANRKENAPLRHWDCSRYRVTRCCRVAVSCREGGCRPVVLDLRLLSRSSASAILTWSNTYPPLDPSIHSSSTLDFLAAHPDPKWQCSASNKFLFVRLAATRPEASLDM